MAIRDALRPEFDMEMATTRRILERVPDGKTDWRPHPKSMPLGRLATHVAEIPGWVVTTLKKTELELMPVPGKPFEPFILKSTAEILALFDKSVADASKALSEAEDPDFQVEWSLKKGGKAMLTAPRAGIYRTFVMNHMIHHRAQLGVYLRLLEVPLPSSYGPTADL
jgi:uncharacterized damage-inducible protein DinB